ncbi:reductase [bacterium]|nr:MAG: reductase [bacterium]
MSLGHYSASTLAKAGLKVRDSRLGLADADLGDPRSRRHRDGKGDARPAGAATSWERARRFGSAHTNVAATCSCAFPYPCILPMSEPATVVIVGAGLAGGRAAEALRQQGYSGRVVLVGEEAERPYERPPLSKERLRGEKGGNELYLRPESYYAEQRIELRLGTRVERIDAPVHRALLSDGSALSYDRLLIATGSTVCRLRVPGAELPGLHYLRTLRDADALAKELASRPKVLMVGAGFIGCEVAASARALGCRVTMIDVATPLAAAIGERLGQWIVSMHRDHGVDVRVGVGVVSLRGAERVEAALLTNGEEVPCDLVVIGVGVTPNVPVVEGATLDVQDGIVVDEQCRTSVADLYAAGDVANWPHPAWGGRLRVEHFDHAQNHGVWAARCMLGATEPYAPVPFFWSDQYDRSIQYVGHAPRWSDLVLRASPESGSFSAFYLMGGRLQACLAVNRFKDLSAAKRLLRTRPAIDRALLSDESVDLKRLPVHSA